MKFKLFKLFDVFKKKESNNSVKTLLKKLKRHDTKVVAVAVIIALILSAGLIYISTPIVASNATEEIAESGRQSSQETAKKLNEINKYLTDLDKVVTSNQKSLSTITENTKSSDTKETIVETGKTTNTISEKVVELGGSLKEVHTTIEKTTTKIDELTKSIEKNETTNKEQLEKDFQAVNQDLSKIQTQYEDAKKQNKELIEKLEKEIADGDKKLSDTSAENQKALLTELENMGKNMDEKNTKTIETFQGDITNLSENLNQQFVSLNNTVNNTVNTGVDDIKEYIGNVSDGLNKRLDQVFQSVSDGKKLLASTLLTKGVKIDEDATFLEISEAILSIPTTITVQGMEGTVVYDKHYHVDGNNTEVNEKYIAIDRKGGCYDKPYYHVHDSSCYTQHTYLQFETNAGCIRHEHAWDENGVEIYRYTCPRCHNSYNSKDGYHYEFADTYQEAMSRGAEKDTIKTKVSSKLICGKDGNTLEGYSCSCGYLNGQILAAHIDYSMNKNLTSLPEIEESNMAVSMSDADAELLFEGLTNQTAGSQQKNALMQLTEYDMNAGNYASDKAKEKSDEENTDNANAANSSESSEENSSNGNSLNGNSSDVSGTEAGSVDNNMSAEDSMSKDNVNTDNSSEAGSQDASTENAVNTENTEANEDSNSVGLQGGNENME